MSFSFNEITENEVNKTLVVDALNLAFRYKHQGRTDFRHEYVATVESFAKSYKCEKIIITADQGSSEYRQYILPTYKANRKEKYDTQSEEEKLYFKQFFLEYENTLSLLEEQFVVLRCPKVEADDLAAYLVKYKSKFNIGDMVLLSSDRDWDLLVQDGVMRFSYVTRKEVTVENWHDHYEVSREQYACFKCLTGDKGDNVPGFTGVGPKRAVELLRQYESAYNIYDNIPLAGHYKYLQEINSNPERILRNYELMDLLTHCDDAIGALNVQEINRRMQ